MKALASDFDNTLYFHKDEEKIKQSDIEAIQKFQEAGNIFGICSGRSLNGIKRDSKDLIDYDFYILTSGACIYDKNHTMIFERTINEDTMIDICERYDANKKMVVHANGQVYTFHTPIERQIGITDPREVTGHIYGISMHLASKEDAKRIVDDINTRYEGVYAYMNVKNVDVVHEDVSKGSGILFVKEYYELDEIAGIGDSYNDIPMLDATSKSFTFTYSPIEMKEKYKIVNSIKEAIENL